ncbi:MAG TPA: alpha/beta fold hydrolase [Anaerolineae bacterium]|jgi:pimeloyl-ACP methyl ester carboxylesterase|nr:alpha/beta fold hydrolase [Anaerolineae bacterium]
MPFASVDDINIYYEIHGSGDPLVLINGLGYDLWMWHKMLPDLADHFQVIVFDNRGAGRSDKPTGPYNVQMLADDLTGLLAALDIKRAAVMGHSMGGFVAQALILSQPKLVDKLILSATNFGGPNHIPVTREALAVLMDMQADPIERLRRGIAISCAPGFAEANPEFAEAWVAHRVKNPLDPQGYQAQLAVGLSLSTVEASFEPRLKNVKAPTLILFGEHDKVVPPGNAELLARGISGSQTRILEDAGHFFPLEVPDAANRIIIDFLKT